MSYGLDGPGDRIPVGGDIFRTCPDRPWGPSSPLYNGYRIFLGVKSGRGVTQTPHYFLVPWSRESWAIPLLSLWAVRPVQSLSACTRVHFTFTFTFLSWPVQQLNMVPNMWLTMLLCENLALECGEWSVVYCNAVKVKWSRYRSGVAQRMGRGIAWPRQ